MAEFFHYFKVPLYLIEIYILDGAILQNYYTHCWVVQAKQEEHSSLSHVYFNSLSGLEKCIAYR